MPADLLLYHLFKYSDFYVTSHLSLPRFSSRSYSKAWPNLRRNALGGPTVQQCGIATSGLHAPVIASQIQETERTLQVDVKDAMSEMAVGIDQDHESGGGREAAPEKELEARREGRSEEEGTGGRKTEVGVEAEVKGAIDIGVGEAGHAFFPYFTMRRGNSIHDEY